MVRKATLLIFGFGSVAQALSQMLMEKGLSIRHRYNTELVITGVVTANHGSAWNPEGIPPAQLTDTYPRGNLSILSVQPVPENPLDAIKRIPADFFIELTPLNPKSGQPALDFIRTALSSGKHVVTANKGPIAHAYRELQALATSTNKSLRFESTVMDGIPIFKLKSCGLPGAEIRSLYGILNSTTHLVLTEMEKGLSMSEAIAKAQALGIAEADPTNDIEGWDAAVKTCILANVMLNADIRPQDVKRQGIQNLTSDDIRNALASGMRPKLICRAVRENTGFVRTTVQPEFLPLDDPLGRLSGTATALVWETDVLTPLGLFELANSSPRQTAYGVLADILHIFDHTHYNPR